MQITSLWPKGKEDQALVTATAIMAGACLLAVFWTPANGLNSRLDILEKVRPSKRPPNAQGAGTDVLAMAQMQPFVMTTGSSAYIEPTVILSGVSVSPGRKAALISVEGGPAEWLVRGGSRNGIGLIDVGGGWAVVQTELGQKRIEIGAEPGSQPETGQ